MMESAGCLLVLLLLLAGNTQAQILYRCVSGSGAVSWQSAVCGQGMRMMKSVEYTPDAPSAVSVPGRVKTVATRSKTRAPAGYRVSARTSRATRRKPDACASASDRREATLERVGLKRNYDLLSKLDADVRRVCR